MRKYFLHDGNQELGPFDFEQIKSKNIKKDTQIWYDGLENWVTADKLEELQSLIIATPPQLPKTPPRIESSSQMISSSDHPAISSKRKSKFWLLMILSLVVIGIIIFWLMQQNKENKEKIDLVNNEISAKEDERSRINEALTKRNMEYRNNWFNYIEASSNRYTYDELGGISNLQVIVTNKTDCMLDEVDVEVSYIKTNGDTYQTETVEVFNIPAHSYKRVSAPESSRGTSVRMEVQVITSKKMHFCYPVDNGNSEDPYFCK